MSFKTASDEIKRIIEGITPDFTVKGAKKGFKYVPSENEAAHVRAFWFEPQSTNIDGAITACTRIYDCALDIVIIYTSTRGDTINEMRTMGICDANQIANTLFDDTLYDKANSGVVSVTTGDRKSMNASMTDDDDMIKVRLTVTLRYQ